MKFKFPHKAPSGYYYEQTQFKRNVIAIWICNEKKFDYNGGEKVSCIWGFLNIKTKQYHSPVNSKTVGKVVNPEKTTPYTAMQLKLNPLEACFQ
jgi:hypothetical protein